MEEQVEYNSYTKKKKKIIKTAIGKKNFFRNLAPEILFVCLFVCFPDQSLYTTLLYCIV